MNLFGAGKGLCGKWPPRPPAQAPTPYLVAWACLLADNEAAAAAAAAAGTAWTRKRKEKLRRKSNSPYIN
eukprot:954948-Pelagomonas_calceolata.AAC.2